MILSAELAANATRHSKRSSHLFWLVCRRLNWFGQSSRQRAADIVQAEVPCNSDDDDDGECWNWGPTLAVVLGAASVARYGLTFRWSVCESEPGRSSSSSSCVLLLLNVDWVFAALPFCRSSPCNSIHKQNFFYCTLELTHSRRVRCEGVAHRDVGICPDRLVLTGDYRRACNGSISSIDGGILVKFIDCPNRVKQLSSLTTCRQFSYAATWQRMLICKLCRWWVATVRQLLEILKRNGNLNNSSAQILMTTLDLVAEMHIQNTYTK